MADYAGLIAIADFRERFEYLSLHGTVGDIYWGGREWLKRQFYNSREWRFARSSVILRDSDGDNVLDLAHPDHPIAGHVYIHHITPITLDMVIKRDPLVFDLNNLVAVSFNTHQAIHYGDVELLGTPEIERFPGDTCPWKRGIT